MLPNFIHTDADTTLYLCCINMNPLPQDIFQGQRGPDIAIKKVLLSLRGLLSSPVTAPDNGHSQQHPDNNDAMKLYVKDREEFERMAKLWTATYAKPKQSQRSPPDGGLD
jgi:ubiquitin-protein ligase